MKLSTLKLVSITAGLTENKNLAYFQSIQFSRPCMHIERKHCIYHLMTTV